VARVERSLDQFEAVGRMRWRMLINSLRTPAGKFELTAQAFINGFFSLTWLGAGIGFGLASWQSAKDHNLTMLSSLLWAVSIAWQVMPILLEGFQGNVDLTFLRRFPVSFRAYAFLHIFLGLFDLSSLMGGLTLLGIWVGTALARPDLLIWTTASLVVFALFNLLLSKAIFAWFEKLFSQRRTRTMFGAMVLILVVGLAAQFRWLPPGLSASAIQMAEKGHLFQATAAFGGLALYLIVVGVLLAIRLHAEYRGESLSKSPGLNPQASALDVPRRVSWFDQVPGSFGALIQKELICFSRNGVLIFGLAAPLLFLFYMAGKPVMNLAPLSQYALPIGIALAMAPFSRQICNSFGAEDAGIQLCFLLPTRFRSIMLAKNILQLGLIGLEAVLVFLIVLVRHGMPSFSIVATTFCWLLFVLPAQLAVGNVLSITMAYRMTKTRISSEPGATSSGLLSLLFQVLLFMAGRSIYLPLAQDGHIELARQIFLLLAIGTVVVWLAVLSKVDRLAESRRSALLASLVRT